MKSNLFTVIFAVVLGLVCALLLTAVAEVVKPRRESNERAERYRNILQVFGIAVPDEAANQDIISIFEEKIAVVGKDIDHPDYYRYGRLVAIPAHGPGLWGPIEGLIGLDADGVTIVAVSFYKQEETPGLGGEIAGNNFTDRFIGKKLFDDGRPVLKLVRPGMAGGPYQVDAISGATMTSNKVQDIITSAGEKFLQARRTGN